MPQFQIARLVNHSAEDMFRLVGDVEAYPEFVPLCKSLSIHKKEQDAKGCTILLTEMVVAYGRMQEQLVTRVLLDSSAKIINASYLQGPFRYLENNWRFEDIGTKDNPRSNVHFFIEYEFKSRVMGLLMGAVFERAFKKFATRFEERADMLYDTDSKRA